MEEVFYRSNPWWEDEFRFSGIKREKYIDKLISYLDNQDIIFLTGLRRVGKTSIMKNLIFELLSKKITTTKYIFYISLDLYLLDNYSISDIVKEYRKIHKISSKEKIYLFLDEITAKESYHIELKNFYDLENVKIFASSSSASLLRDKNAYLTGRQRVLEVLPLDFDEYLDFRDIRVKKSDAYLLESYFQEYMQDGGMPEFVLTKDVTYLQNLIDNIISKDIIAHYNIRNSKVIKDYFKLLMERSGKQLSLNKIANILDISVDSAKRYFNYFEECYLIYSIDIHGKLNQKIKSVKKIYASDVGLKNVVTGYRDKGAIFENLVFLKIKNKNPSYLYVDGIEIDFVTEDKTLIEVKYHSSLNKKQQKLFDSFKAKKKLIVDGYEKFMLLP